MRLINTRHQQPEGAECNFWLFPYPLYQQVPYMIVTDSLDTRRRRIDGDLVTDQLDVALMKVSGLNDEGLVGFGVWTEYKGKVSVRGGW